MSTRIFKLFALFFIAFSIQLNAQKFDIGLLAGPQAYTVSFEDKDDRDEYDSKIKLGYRAGAYILFPLENDFAWSVEGFFSRKGRNLESNFNGQDVVNNASYNFIELNFLLRKEFNLTLIKGLEGKWFLNIGPNINYWLSGKGTIDATVDLDYKVKFEDGPGDFEYNYIRDGNRWLFGIDFGIGIDNQIIKSQKVEAELRFTLGQTFLGAKDGSVPVNDFQVNDNLRANYRVLALVIRYGIGVDFKNARKGKSTLKIKKRKR
ncbi:porin family protein [Fulvivirga lutea]|uniref:PorT family protein n=1 Tax=Fulvivirga lutea TaxID=2810512 RepID=A0A974WK09_9BACT|nr:porin family protein [Fulvivirga lutea]QSE96783.1 PorT family protein [Fulvivirga lutea]